ncbi:MAG: hypothetical protein J6K44_01680 [Clostridia bacterium]|nr:hypothetical protein [Clostridia bacterium]
MDVFVIVLVIGLFVLFVVGPIVYKRQHPEEYEALEEARNRTPAPPPQPKPQAPKYPPFFEGLFSRLDHFKEQGVHKHIDILLYSLFKGRMFTVAFVDGKVEPSNKDMVMEAYDLAMFISIGYWMDKYAPSFIKKTEITDSRMLAYEKTYMKEASDLMALMNLSKAFYWFLEKGWELDAEGKKTTMPNTEFEPSTLFFREVMDVEGKYVNLQAELEEIVFGYYERELGRFILSLKPW